MPYELLLLNVTRNSSDISSAFREYLGGHIIASYVAEYDFRAKYIRVTCWTSSA